MKRLHRKYYWQIPFLLFLIIGSIYVVRQKQTAPFHRHEGFIFGTVYHFTYQSEDDLHQELIKVLQDVDNTLSTFNENSVLAAVNRGENPVLTPMFCKLFREAQQVSEETEGAFDVTVAPMVNAWGFGFKQGRFPTDDMVDSLLQIVGYRKVSIKEEKDGWHLCRPDHRMMLDFSAIAKGYGVDCVADYLKSKGVTNFMVEIGGEIAVGGHNDKQQDWHIGVTKPTDDSLQLDKSELQTVLKLTDVCMATSGNYRNFYYQGGKKIAHTIDPHTGRPVQHSLLSATVLAPSCGMADAYATSFMVMGVDKAKQLLARHPELKAYLIYPDEKGEYAVWQNLPPNH